MNPLQSRSIEINKRFFDAFDVLKEKGAIRSTKEFCDHYGIIRPGFLRIRKDPERKFELAYLEILVNDFGVSANWLITGRGTSGL